MLACSLSVNIFIVVTIQNVFYYYVTALLDCVKVCICLCVCVRAICACTSGDEFLMPLQAFFCSLCCEFSKDSVSAESHLRSRDHNNKFKV